MHNPAKLNPACPMSARKNPHSQDRNPLLPKKATNLFVF